MARPMGAALGLSLVACLAVPGRVGPATAQETKTLQGPRSVQYTGPTALQDPEDPLQSVSWTLGLTLPRRHRLPLGRNPAVRRAEYDIERQRVTMTYKSGDREILPPLALSGEQYAHLGFEQGLRSAWIQDTGNVIPESVNRGGSRGGLVNVSLPFQLPFTEKLFGEGAPNLRVTGSEQITISGTSSWVVGQVTGERGGASLFPKLDMRQNLRVNLEGTIGSKLFVNVSQNSDALTPLENSIQIRYRGEEDEVVQSVELGNTNLSLPPTQFVSYSARQEGLFGVKTTATVGNIDLTAIASRQEGESGQATYTGGNQERTIRIRDWGFTQGKYFFVTDPDSERTPDPASLVVRVYVDDRTYNNNTADGAQTAEVWIDPEARTPVGAPYVGSFHQLHQNVDYHLFNTETLANPVLELTTPLSPDHVLAVAYQGTIGGTPVTVGSFDRDSADTTALQLKMIRPGEDKWGTDQRNNVVYSTWAPVRRLEIKNRYYLGARDIDPGSFELRIVRDEAGADGNNHFTVTNEHGKETPFIEVLGLDQKNNANPNDRTPDGRVDPEFIDYDEGVLYFPDLRPFDPGIVDIAGNPDVLRNRSWPVAGTSYERPDTLGWTRNAAGNPVPSPAEIRNRDLVPEIYDLLPQELSRAASDFHEYTMEATIKSASANTIQLTQIGAVLEGSETVRLNGQILQRGTDYSIFYETGTVTLKHPDATAPGADLIITYSYDSPFTRSQQSLVGGSIQTRPDPNATLSFSTSWLHESRGSPDRRPRLGQEPVKTTVGDVSGRLRFDVWGLTRMVDAIPGVRTSAPSRIEVWGAAGVSMPNPNTRGEVYIDDMEGADVITAPGINRGAWFYSSAPAKAYRFLGSGEGRPFYEFVPTPEGRGELLWFSPSTVRVRDITPREDSDQTQDDLVNVLEVIYVPQEGAGPEGSWGGLVTPLAAGGIDISRAQYIEILVNDYVNYTRAGERRGEILVDVGSVSEDAVWDPLTPPAPPNGVLDYEDKNQSGGQVDFVEDLGLDGLASPARSDLAEPEPPFDPSKRRLSPFSPAEDPAGDDKVREIETSLRERNVAERILKYRGINGTEANQRTDGEDLDGNFLLDRADDYVEYRIDLASEAFVDNGRDFGITDPENGWRRYRIPLDEFLFSEGIPNLSQVKHMRIWFKGIDPGDTLDVQVASIEIVGNRWEASEFIDLEVDELFNVSTVNNKENPEYIEPFEVERINNVKEREQSLSLDFENMRPGNEYLAFNRLFEARDYTLYRTFSFYVHPRLQEVAGDSVEFFLRFGSEASSDTLGYYELATTLTESDPRRRPDGWLDFQADVGTLSGLKPGDTVPADSVVAQDVVLGNGLRVTVRGNPSFSRVRRVSVGIRNVSGRVLPAGSVWFDELRMGDVRRDRGYATRGFVSLQLADLANVQASADFNTADFLRLGQLRGSGSENLRYDLRGQVSLHKFLEPLHINAPLALRMSRSKRTPKFRPNSDVLFSGDASGREIARTVDRHASLSLARDIRGGSNFLTRYTIDNIRLNGNMGQVFRDEVTRSDSTFTRQGSLSYGLSLSHIRPLSLFNRLDLWPWPRSVSMNLAGGTTTRRVWTPDVETGVLAPTNNSTTRTGSMNIGTSLQPINGLTYSFNSNRDLIDEHFANEVVRRARPADTFLGIDIGRQVLQTHNLSFSFTPPILSRTVRPRFTWTSGSNMNLAPSLTLENYGDAVFDIRNNNSASISLTVPLGKWMQGLVGPPRAGAASRFQAGPDSAAAPAGGEKSDLTTMFTEVIRLKDVQLSGSVGRQSAYSRINGSPSPQYMLGLTQDINLGSDVNTVENAPFNQSSGRSNGVRGNTAVTLFRQVGVDLSYQKSKSLTRTNNLVGAVRDDTTWPEMSFNWGDLQRRIPLLNKLFTDFRAVNTSFSKVTNTSGTEIDPKESVTTQVNWRPLISLSGTLKGWRTSLNANRSSSETISQRVGSARTRSNRSQVSYTLSLAKKFVRVMGGQGRDVDFKADLSYTTNNSETRSSFSDIPIEDKRDQVRLNTSAGIRLTSAMSGTVGLELGQERNKTKDWTRRSIRLYFSTGFNF